MIDPGLERLDRHALVMAIWLSFGFMALALLRFALNSQGWILGVIGFAPLLLAFAGHVIVNAVTGTFFSQKEIALGLVAQLVGILAFVIACWSSESFRVLHAAGFGLGLIGVIVAVVFYMLIHFGLRRSFDSFDVIRRFRD